MKISTEIGSAARHVGEERAVEYIAKAGFDAWDFSMFEMCGYDWGTKTALKDVYKRQLVNAPPRSLHAISRKSSAFCRAVFPLCPLY